MGKITPRFFLAVLIFGLFLLSEYTALANFSFGPEKPYAHNNDRTYSYFIGFLLNEELSVTITETPASCNDTNDGDLEANASGGASPYNYSWTGPNGFTGSTNQISNLAPGDYTLTLSDNNNLEITEVFTLTFNDNENPTASNPAPVNVQCTADIPTVDIAVVTDEADNCTANPTVAFVSDASDGNSNPEIIIRTYSVTDDAGNSINVTQEITVNDTTDPTASNPAPLNVQCIADVPTEDITVVTDEADNCTANPTVAFVSDVSDGNSNPEIITRTYSVTDDAGNSINVTQEITVNDTTDPTASNPAPLNVQCIADVPEPDITVVTDETDNCTANPTVVFVSDASDGNSNPEIITRTYSVTDDAGNSINVTQEITVDDTTAPTASNPAPLNVQCIADVPEPDITVVTDEADNCTANPTVAFVSDVSDGNSNPEIITRTYSVTDDAGNSINVTQQITVDDTTDPTASNPAPLNIQCIADGPEPDITVVTDEADNCTANPTVAFVSDASDGNSNPEIITRTYSVTDDAGNSINVTQEITVDDTTDPTASNPAPLNVQCIADVPEPDITVVTDEADNCTANPTVAFVSDVSDGNSNPEIITRTYSVTDDAGNSINVTQEITVNDTTDPTASNPAPLNVQCAADVPAADTTVVTDEADNCTSNPVVAFVSDVSDGNSNPEIIIRTYSVTDDAGNSINVTQEITVDDTTDPTIPTLPDLVSECPLTVTPPTTSDNCDGTITGTTGLTNLTFDASETIYWYFKDAAGNEIGPIEQNVIINNTIAPVPDSGSLPKKIISGCQITSIDELDIPTATDACEGTISGNLSENFEFPYSFTGTNTIEWEFIDSKGNKSIQIQEIELKPLDVDGGTLKGTFESSVFQEQIDISACGEAISVELDLTAERGNIIHWEKFSVNRGIWEIINNTGNSHTANFAEGELVSTYYRVLIQTGTCAEYSNSFYIRTLPVGDAPTVENLEPETNNKYCLGDEVNLLAKSNYTATQPALPNEAPGDFNQGQLNTQDPNSWLTDGNPGGFTAGGNSKKPRNWSGTNDHEFGDITYDGGDGKFAIAQGDFSDSQYKGNNPTTLESPILDLSNAVSASLDFDQAFYFANGDNAVIEISTDGGSTYSTLQIMHSPGTGIKKWFTAGTAESYAGSNASNYNFSTDNTSISLEDYIGENNVRIRWKFTGTSDKSVWAMDNIIVNEEVFVDTELEWTDGIGDPNEDPIVVGRTEVPIAFTPAVPGQHEYGGTALINGCRTYNEEGTDLINILVSYSYAGEDIILSNDECGQNTVQLNAYDNTLTATENNEKGAYPSKPTNCINCDDPGTGEIGTWTWTRLSGTNNCVSESFSDINDPNATFTGNEGTYNLTWTVDGCSDSITVEIKECNQINFDGINDYIDFSKDNYHLSNSTNKKAFSIEVWVKPESTSGIQTIFSKRDANYADNKGYDLSIHDGEVSFNWNNSGTINSSPHKVQANRWYHIAVTHSSSGEYKLYVDGVLIKSTAGGSPDANLSKALLGAVDQSEFNVPTNHFHGWMEEFRIWNVALTPNQLREMMNQHIENNGAAVAGEVLPFNIKNLNWVDLIGYYRMDKVNCGNLYPYNDGSDIGFPGELKNITTSQQTSAPLPYESEASGNWHTRNSWDPNATKHWTFPNDIGIDNETEINWNIAVQNNDLNSNNKDIKLLGLFSEPATQLKMQGENNASGNELRITHYLELNGHIDLNGESQLVQSEGSILTGSGYLTRDQQGTASSYNYNYWSSPVVSNTGNQSYTIASVMHDGTDKASPKNLDIGPPGHVTYADGNYSVPRKISGRWLYKFRGDANQYSEWKYIGKDGTLLPGEGYTMKGTSGNANIQDLQNYTFKGFPNNGPLTNALNIANDQNYLLGNPYPSAIEVKKFILDNLSKHDVNGATNTKNIFNGALYFWDHFGGKTHILREYVGGYATINLSGAVQSATSIDERINNDGSKGTKKPGPFIPVAQGFFVNTVLDPGLAPGLSISGGDINFNNGQRAFASEVNPNNSQFLKPNELTKGQKTEITKDSRYKIRLNFSSPLGYQREILVTADNYTTNGFDLGYDALLNDNIPEDMYWLIKDSKFVIQGVPNFNLDQKLPIGITLAEEKEFSIELGDLENMPDIIDIYLRDNSDSSYHDLRKAEYKASLPAGEYNSRYEIVFQDPNSMLEDKEPGQGPIDYYYSLANREFVISNPELHKIEHINIYNIGGQLVDQHFGIPDIKEIHILQKKSLSSGVYIVKVYTDAGDYAKKVIIRKD
ncbi:LamG-like jellyroll fold domain-containing protein [uncultured Salegentibacter sp.]|uniref:LamG-like jellyroll fold domain-containing protein n=1 Tax=uncultured Salegentibacter sp. TaxID=259320 RepID=UPI002591AF1D|nr:LamG-like jellyroll fold domain-containing protein [uncultured Salegentibacter sp.]